MKRYHFLSIFTLFLLAAVFCFPACKNNMEKSPYLVAAYIWPSCHDDSLAHKYLWPEGIGEWEVIKQGDPRFEGHYQPKQPLWGYEMDDDPVVVEKWIRTALKYGVNTFVYDWYWFMDYPYLEGALNDGFLKAPSNQKMNFYIMWANHDVKWNYWNYHLHGDNTDILFNPDVNWDQFKVIVDRIIRQYFPLPNYLKFDGRPVMSIFSMNNIIRSFGSFDCDYEKHCQNSLDIREAWDGTFGIPVYPCVSIGWDDTPRFPAKGENDVTRFNHSPEVFAKYLYKAKNYADAHPDQPKLITINAWNEWVEGSYLLPDKVNGFGYLEAVRDVFSGRYKPE